MAAAILAHVKQAHLAIVLVNLHGSGAGPGVITFAASFPLPSVSGEWENFGGRWLCSLQA